MSQAFKCDRCGTYFEPNGNGRVGGVIFNCNPFIEEFNADDFGLACDKENMLCRFDLCRECAISVFRFVMGQNVRIYADNNEYVATDDLGGHDA